MRSALSLTILLAFLAVPSGCTGLPKVPVLPQVPLTLPEGHRIVREQLMIHSNFSLTPQHRLVEDLAARRHDLSRCLGLPLSDELIHIYLFEDGNRFRAFMRLHRRGDGPRGRS